MTTTLNHSRMSSAASPRVLTMPMRCSAWCLAVALLPALLVSHVIGLAKEPAFEMQGYPTGWGGSCDSNRSKVLAGALFFVDVCNRADEPKVPRKPGWPEGYALEAALDLPQESPFVPTPGLINRLQPMPYMGSITRSEQRRLDSGDLEHVDVGWLNLKSFTLRMPDNLAGHTITLRARCDKGGSARYSTRVDPFEVIRPCDRYDTARVVAGEIYLAWEEGDLDRIIQVADSMLEAGLSDAAAWRWARDAYLRQGLIDKAVTCLDRLYEDYGVTDFIGSGNLRLNRNGARDPQVQQSYQQLRASYMELKNQQPQH